ncbi:hypothetical protein EW145_g860 [Phellinidium pouzarii]|uniref:Ribosomal protein S16 n=1 Tax=Phellinidium pouzarii TaxID=167371 RepID=A0A4S4LGN6_9AGAM|nr:hypothetical protein EW145_g860 [Phellinidium pouzarii]
MPVRLRFAMHGPRDNKVFHIVAINSRQRRDAKPIETLGIYKHYTNSTRDRTTKSVDWSVARIKYWLDVGAQPSKAAVKLLTQGGVLPPNSKYHTSKNVPEGLPEPESEKMSQKSLLLPDMKALY